MDHEGGKVKRYKIMNDGGGLIMDDGGGLKVAKQIVRGIHDYLLFDFKMWITINISPKNGFYIFLVRFQCLDWKLHHALTLSP